MRFFGNVIWLMLGGIFSGLLWYVCGILAAVTVVGAPWSSACFRLGNFTLWPFGRQLVDRRLVTGREDVGTGFLGLLGNILWFVTVGWSLFLAHLASALVCALTVIGIPLAVQHLKLAMACLAPIGKEVVEIP
jgi:uncharacterized membrane protein YccF (DUF307 family)